MKHNINFNHDLNTTESFGISEERFNELKMFYKDYLPRICEGKPRSFVVEQILEYCETPGEAMIVYGWIEAQRVPKNIVIEVSGDGPVPQQILDLIVGGNVTVKGNRSN